LPRQRDAKKKAASLTHLQDIGLLQAQSSSTYAYSCKSNRAAQDSFCYQAITLVEVFRLLA